MMAAPAGGGGGGVSTPDVILGSDLIGWFQPGGVGVYDNTTGGSLVSTAGTEVGRWEDQSGNGSHFVRNGSMAFGHLQWEPATTDNRGFGSVQFSFLNVVTLLAATGLCGALNAAGQGELWVKMMLTRASGSDGGPDFSSAGANAQFEWSDGHVYETFGTNARKDTGIPSIQATVTSAFFVYNVYGAPGDWQSFFNNTSQFSTLTNTIDFHASGSTFWYPAYVNEIVFSKAKSSTTQRGDMYTYLTT